MDSSENLCDLRKSKDPRYKLPTFQESPASDGVILIILAWSRKQHALCFVVIVLAIIFQNSVHTLVATSGPQLRAPPIENPRNRRHRDRAEAQQACSPVDAQALIHLQREEWERRCECVA